MSPVPQSPSGPTAARLDTVTPCHSSQALTLAPAGLLKQHLTAAMPGPSRGGGSAVGTAGSGVAPGDRARPEAAGGGVMTQVPKVNQRMLVRCEGCHTWAGEKGTTQAALAALLT